LSPRRPKRVFNDVAGNLLADPSSLHARVAEVQTRPGAGGIDLLRGVPETVVVTRRASEIAVDRKCDSVRAEERPERSGHRCRPTAMRPWVLGMVDHQERLPSWVSLSGGVAVGVCA